MPSMFQADGRHQVPGRPRTRRRAVISGTASPACGLAPARLAGSDRHRGPAGGRSAGAYLMATHSTVCVLFLTRSSPTCACSCRASARGPATSGQHDGSSFDRGQPGGAGEISSSGNFVCWIPTPFVGEDGCRGPAAHRCGFRPRSGNTTGCVAAHSTRSSFASAKPAWTLLSAALPPRPINIWWQTTHVDRTGAMCISG